MAGTGMGTPEPGSARPGPPLGATNEGLVPPATGNIAAGEGERDGDARVGTGPGIGAAGNCPTFGKLGVGTAGKGDGRVTGLAPGCGTEGIGAAGAGGTGTLGSGTAPVSAGVGKPGAGPGNTGTGTGLGTAAEGNGAGVPSLGFILGAKGDRVTRNFGPPSPGLTGAPSLGVSLRVGFGGLGNPSDITNQFKMEYQFRASESFNPLEYFFESNQKFHPWWHFQ